METMYSANWMFQSVCDGTDKVLNFAITGTTTGTYKIVPWRTEPIIIVGVEITKFTGSQTVYGMSGNGYTPDAMAFVGQGENHTRNMFPAGMGMPFPGSGAGTQAYLDLHYVCVNDGSPLNIFYTVYYVLAV